MIGRHDDFKNRIVALDDLAFKRIGESNCCGSQKNRSDKKSHGERSHDLTDKRDSNFGYQKSTLLMFDAVISYLTAFLQWMNCSVSHSIPAADVHPVRSDHRAACQCP